MEEESRGPRPSAFGKARFITRRRQGLSSVRIEQRLRWRIGLSQQRSMPVAGSGGSVTWVILPGWLRCSPGCFMQSQEMAYGMNLTAT